MRIKEILKAIFFTLLLSSKVYAGDGHDHSDGHHDHHKDEPAHGPHGGRLLEKDKFALELKIFEEGVPPQYRIYGYLEEEPLAASAFEVEVLLKRFDRTDHFAFKPKGDYLTSDKVVEEPHSFVVTVTAKYNGKVFEWEFDSFEGRTVLSEEALKIANLEYETVQSHEIENSTRVYGRLIPNEDKVAHLIPRFSGVVTEIHKSLGDKVSKGEVLATVESNQALQTYHIRSQIEGVVIKRHATLGEFVSDSREIFVVADLSEIWADFQVYRDDVGPISVGQRISIDLGSGGEIPATVSYVSPITDSATQSKLIRAILPNKNGALRPGLFVSGILSSSQRTVPLAVRREAIQSFRDWNVVYLKDGHVFQAMPVKIGQKDSKYVEILSGLKEGDRYVSKNSYIIKADIEKSGAAHDH